VAQDWVQKTVLDSSRVRSSGSVTNRPTWSVNSKHNATFTVHGAEKAWLRAEEIRAQTTEFVTVIQN
jgi:hypothetical protein